MQNIKIIHIRTIEKWDEPIINRFSFCHSLASPMTHSNQRERVLWHKYRKHINTYVLIWKKKYNKSTESTKESLKVKLECGINFSYHSIRINLFFNKMNKLL